MKPNFLVIGSAKCATTSLCTLLGRHPDVFMSSPKEPHFFSLDKAYSRGWGWYESLFAGAEGKAAIGEGSTSYTKHMVFPDASRRIAEHLPEARLIYMVRNPFEKIESQWMHAKANNFDVPVSFDEAVRQIENYVDEARYWHQISQYRERFADENLLVLFFEDFKADPDAVLERCFKFLEVDPTVTISDAGRPSNVSHEDGALMSVIRKVPLLNKAYFALPQKVRYRFNAKLRKPVVSRPVWGDDLRRWFFEQIAEDTRAFLDQFGKPVDFWFTQESAPMPTPEAARP